MCDIITADTSVKYDFTVVANFKQTDVLLVSLICSCKINVVYSTVLDYKYKMA